MVLRARDRKKRGLKTTLARASGKVARDRYDITISFLRDVPMLPELEGQNRISLMVHVVGLLRQTHPSAGLA
jgi:hypothetical protein